MKHLAVVAALAFAAPALAAEPVALSDAELDRVSGGTGSVAPTSTNINVNASPIVVTQTAVALNLQNAAVKSNGRGKGKAWGLLKQSGFAAAANTVKINYHVVQINNAGG
jgi:hypothetical protein